MGVDIPVVALTFQACQANSVEGIHLGQELISSVLRSRFGDDEQALANIQIKYCRQWFTTALCHAKTKEACKDTISRLGMYMLEPSRSHDFTKECQLQVADLMALVAPALPRFEPL